MLRQTNFSYLSLYKTPPVMQHSYITGGENMLYIYRSSICSSGMRTLYR